MREHQHIRYALWELIGNGMLVGNTIIIAYKHPSYIDLRNRRAPSDYREFYGVVSTYMAWYTYMTLVSYVTSFKDFNASILFHHVVALSLMTISYMGNSLQYAFVVLFVLTLSNPFMHLAKYLHLAGRQRAKVVAYVCFMAVFGACRILMFTILVLRHCFGAYDAYKSAGALGVYYSCNTLLLAIYALQWVWLKKVVDIFRAGDLV